MKRLLPFLAPLILLACVPMWTGAMWLQVLGGGAVAAASLTQDQIVTGTEYAVVAIGDATARTYIASLWTKTTTRSIAAVDVTLGVVGTPTGTLTAYFYTAAGGPPVTVTALVTNGTSNAVAVPSGNAVVRFTFPSPPSLTDTAKYYLVIKASAISGTNYTTLRVSDPAGSPVSNSAMRSDTAGTWTNQSDYAKAIFTTYY